MNLTHSAVVKDNFDFSKGTFWIHASGDAKREWFMTRKKFTVSGGEKVALALLTAYYAEVYINGVRAARFSERAYIFNPQYKAVDITHLVNKGENTLVVLYIDAVETQEEEHCGFAVEIKDGANSVAQSDSSFKAKSYEAISKGTDFFIKGPHFAERFDAEKDDLAEVCALSYDDSAWERVIAEGDTLTREPYDFIHQDICEFPTENALYAKSFVAFDRSIPETGIFVKIPWGKDKKIMCESVIAGESDFTFKIEPYGGVEKIYIDGVDVTAKSDSALTGGGNEGAAKTQISLPAGAHRIALYGEAPNLFIKGEGFSLVSPNGGAEWVGSYEEFKSETPVFPWNGYREDIVPHTFVKEFLEAKSFYELSEERKAQTVDIDVSNKRSMFDTLSKRRYFKYSDSVSDERLLSHSTYIDVDEDMGVTGRETVFSPNADMVIPASDKDTTFILDFGIERIGGIYLDIDAKAGNKIICHALEVINKEEGVRFYHDHQTLIYTAKEGNNKYLSHVRRGFRYLYVCVTARENPITIKELGVNEWRYPAEDKARFTSSSERLNGVYNMCVETTKLCMLDSYVDCPGYEQNVWTGDAKITSLVNLSTLGAYEFNRRYLTLIGESLSDGVRKYYRRRNPRYIAGNYLTCGTFPTFPDGTIPIWSFSWVLSVVDHYEHTGDFEYLKTLLPAVEENLRRAENMLTEHGLFEMNGAWSLIDWAYNDVSEYGEITTNNMMLSYCFKRISEIEKFVGNDALAEKYATLGKTIKDAINKYCWSEERGAYLDMLRDEEGYKRYVAYYAETSRTPLSFEDYMALSRVSVHTNTFAVLYEIAEGERYDAALKMIEDCTDGNYIGGSPKRRSIGEPSEEEAPGGIVRVGTPFFMYFVLAALFKAGKGEFAVKAISRDWGGILDEGITTCLEGFNKKDKWVTRSIAHAWSSSPAAFLINEVLGVKPVEPGFKSFTVTPCLAELTYAKGSVPTPYGEIYVEVKRTENGIDIKVDAPKECKRV